MKRASINARRNAIRYSIAKGGSIDSLAVRFGLTDRKVRKIAAGCFSRTKVPQIGRNTLGEGWTLLPGYQPSQAIIDAWAELDAYRAGLADGTIQRRTLTEDEEMLRDHMLNG